MVFFRRPPSTRPYSGRPTACHQPMCPTVHFVKNTARLNTPQNVNKPKKKLLTSHTMSHSAQFHKIFILSCCESSCKFNRNITVPLGRKAISVLCPVSTTPKTYDTTLLSRPNYVRAPVQS